MRKKSGLITLRTLLLVGFVSGLTIFISTKAVPLNAAFFVPSTSVVSPSDLAENFDDDEDDDDKDDVKEAE